MSERNTIIRLENNITRLTVCRDTLCYFRRHKYFFSPNYTNVVQRLAKVYLQTIKRMDSVYSVYEDLNISLNVEEDTDLNMFYKVSTAVHLALLLTC